MLTRTLWLVVIACFLSFSFAHAAGVEVAVGAWQQTIGGSVGYEAPADDDILDLEDDLDFDDETKAFGRLKIDMPAFFPNLYFVAAPAEFDGSGTESGTIEFGGTEFDFSTDLDVEITLNQSDIGLYYGLPFVQAASAGKFNIDVGLNVRLLDLKAKASGIDNTSGLAATEEQSLSVPVPMAYLALQIMPTDWLAFEVEGRGLAVGDDSLFSLIGRIRYHFAGPVFAAVGYRSDMLDVDEEDVEIDVDISGGFLELGFKF